MAGAAGSPGAATGNAGAAEPGGGAGIGGSATEGGSLDCANTVDDDSSKLAASCHQRGLRRDGIVVSRRTCSDQDHSCCSPDGTPSRIILDHGTRCGALKIGCVDCHQPAQGNGCRGFSQTTGCPGVANRISRIPCPDCPDFQLRIHEWPTRLGGLTAFVLRGCLSFARRGVSGLLWSGSRSSQDRSGGTGEEITRFQFQAPVFPGPG
jgi:hypothetical protein